MENLPEVIDIIITQETILKNGAGFMSIRNCPLATEAKRILGFEHIMAYDQAIVNSSSMRDIYLLEKPFTSNVYEVVKSTGMPFRTQAKLIK